MFSVRISLLSEPMKNVAFTTFTTPKNELYHKFGIQDGSAGLLGAIVRAGPSKDQFVRVSAGKEFYIVTTDASK